MADKFVDEAMCLERCRRLEEEDKRQNERLRQLETMVDRIHALAANTEKLATAMEQMCVEQREQGSRISKLEERDGEKWRSVVKTALTVIVSAVIGAVLTLVLPK